MKKDYNKAKIILGVSGSVAAYKAVYLGREFIRHGAQVRVAMTENGAKFVTPLTFRSALNAPVVVEQFANPDDWNLEHISWSRWSDLFVVAPATANIIAKAATGIADDFLSTTLLAAQCPVLFVPAMNTAMYLHPATQENMQRVCHLGYDVLPPDTGELACRESGSGRFPEIATIIDTCAELLNIRKTLSGKRILVTAGATREYIDSTRFLSNPSTGRMGFAIAEMAKRMGADVILVFGSTHLAPLSGVESISVTTANEMHDAVISRFADVDAVIMSAAVADYKPVEQKIGKMKKDKNNLNIKFTRTPDILAELGQIKENQKLIGFALETDEVLNNARKKLESKNLDLIIANKPGKKTGFAVSTNKAFIIYRNRKNEVLPLMSKRELAHKILSRLVKLFKSDD